MKIKIDKSELKRKAFNIGLVLVLAVAFVFSSMMIIALALIVDAS